MSNEFCGSFGINTKAGFIASGAIGAALNVPDKRIELLAENFSYPDQLIGGMGITGSINPITAHLRTGQRLVVGGIVFEVGPNELAPWIRTLCSNTAADSTDESFDLIPWDFVFQRDLVTHGYRYNVLRQAVIKGRSNPEDPEDQILQMALSFLGVEEHAGVSFPGGLGLPGTDRLFWIIADSVLTVAGVTHPIIGFDITIQHQLIPLFRNQLKPGCFRCIGREITLKVMVPYSATSATALFGANDTNLNVTLAMTSSNLAPAFAAYATSFNFPTMRRITKNANTDSKAEVPLVAVFRSYQAGSATNMTITNAIV